tara:strand:- start:384 stop:710 length:327 start_codon:yes stop_codon:yes gene_type:complete
MKEPTNKELLEIILEKTKESARENASFAGKVSTFMNEQRDFNALQVRLNDKFEGYFESNPKTNQTGSIEQTQINKNDISKIKTDKKIVYSFGIAIAFLSNIIFKYFWK